MWLESSFYTGACQAPAHPAVRMWNRYVAAVQTATSPVLGKHKSGNLFSVDKGRAIERARLQLEQNQAGRPRECQRFKNGGIIPYDTTHVVYAIVPLRRGERLYVGVTARRRTPADHGQAFSMADVDGGRLDLEEIDRRLEQRARRETAALRDLRRQRVREWRRRAGLGD